MDGSTPPPQTDDGFVKSLGMKFPKHPEIMKGKIRRLLRSGSYERKETTAALRIVRRDDVVLELGGGIGYMSTLVATRRPIKSVHVFEANPELIPYIHQVHEANGVTNAHVTNAILGEKKGTVDFYVRDPMLGSSMQILEGEENPPAPVKVDVLNAKTVMDEIKPTILICDIEGAEMDLIPKMDLSSLRAAVIETHPQWIGPEGMNKVMSAFISAGLAYCHRSSEGKVLAFRDSY